MNREFDIALETYRKSLFARIDHKKKMEKDKLEDARTRKAFQMARDELRALEHEVEY